ncbi:MAG: S8 family serine peptidase, partial [Acidobacteria bacterium]|nr:S8 family serine peptidase [Acidobacteriota bacterium]
LLDRKGSFSNFGSYVDMAAPGVNVFSAYPGGYYIIASGTSFAAPIIAGATALLRAQSSVSVEDALKRGAVNIDDRNPEYAEKLGKGRVDVFKSLKAR